MAQDLEIIWPGDLASWSKVALAKQGDKILTAAAISGDGTLHVAWVNDTGPWQGPVPVHGAARRICQLTGNYDPEGLPHINDSTLVHIGGTDLGIPVEHQGRLVFLFGDQFDDPYCPNGDPIGVTGDQEVAPSGFRLGFLTETGTKDHFRPLRVAGLGPLADFETPTGGFSDGERFWAFINKKVAGTAADSQNLLASTQDLSADFTLNYRVSYSGGDMSVPQEIRIHNRLNLAGARVINGVDWPGLPSGDAEGLLVWGQAYGPWQAFLGYVPLPLPAPPASADQFPAAHQPIQYSTAPQLPVQYYKGQGPDGLPQWDPAPEHAVGLFDLPAVSFISLSWVPALGYWLALYTECWPYPHRDDGPGKPWQRPIVLRSAPAPWGPWSDPLPLLHPSEAYGRYLYNPEGGPQPARYDPEDMGISGWLYCPAMIDRFQRGAKGFATVYYTLSTGKPYQVQLMRSDLHRLPGG